MAAPNCFHSRKRSFAISNIGGRWFSGGPVFFCVKPKPELKHLKAISSHLRTWTILSTLFGAPQIATKPRIKLLAYEFSRETVEQIGVRIRSESRLVDGRYIFSEHQADQILDLRLYQLTGLEREKIIDEYGEIIRKIDDLLDILDRADRVMTIIKEELLRIRDKYGSERLTAILPGQGDITYRGSDRQRGMHHYHHPRRLHQTDSRKRISRPDDAAAGASSG